MLRRLLGALERPPPRDLAAQRRLAIAVLLHETARADFEHIEVEAAAIRRELAQHLQIEPAALDVLLGEARTAARESVSLHDFVSAINASHSASDKRELMAMLWRVAWADGRIDPHEEHLIRRLADLLFVPHADFIREKLGARQA